MKRYIVSRPAETDLRAIQTYLVAEAGARLARKVMHEIREAIRFLASHPAAGHLRQDLADYPLRFWPVYSYLVIYDPSRKPIEVLRILHGAQDVATLLERRG